MLIKRPALSGGRVASKEMKLFIIPGHGQSPHASKQGSSRSGRFQSFLFFKLENIFQDYLIKEYVFMTLQKQNKLRLTLVFFFFL